MSEYLPLDKAAIAVNKSEVTLRRLIKTGRIPFEKQKTLTGFIYLIRPDDIAQYYHTRKGVKYTPEGKPLDPQEAQAESETAIIFDNETKSGTRVRVAVAGESGNTNEYWQKKAEAYEEKYFNELTKHAQAREELGVWRGRAEHSQAMLLRLLPAQSEVTVEGEGEHGPNEKRKSNSKEVDLSGMFTGVMAGLVIIILIVVYLVFLR